jgi:hypothetical protein
MFGLKDRVRTQAVQYLQVIRPWAVGKDNRGWVHSDFYVPSQDPDVKGEVPLKDVYDYRTDPSHIIFPLIPYQIGLLDRLFMDVRLYDAMLHLNQTINNFNATVAEFARAQTVEVRWNFCVMLHAGLIGTTDGAGLFERYTRACYALGGSK